MKITILSIHWTCLNSFIIQNMDAATFRSQLIQVPKFNIRIQKLAMLTNLHEPC